MNARRPAPALRLVHYGLLLLSLLPLGNLAGPTGLEYVRLALISGGLLLAAHRLGGAPTDSAVPAVMAALTLMFALAQFDPGRGAGTGFNWFSATAVGLVGLSGGALAWALARRPQHQLRLLPLGALDKLVLFTGALVLALSLGTRQVFASDLIDLASPVKVLQFVLLWFLSTRLYAPGALSGGLHRKWRELVGTSAAVFAVAVGVGAYRTYELVSQYDKGERHLAAGHTDEALSAYRRAGALNQKLQLDGYWDGLWTNRASIHLRRGELEQAEKAIAALRAHRAGDPSIHRQIGDLFFRARMWDRAVDQYRRALEGGVDRGTVLDRLATSCVETGRYDLCASLLGDYGWSDRVQGDAFETRIFLGHIALDQGRVEGAVEHFARAVDVGEDRGQRAQALYKLAKGLVSQGAWEQALERLRQALELNPELADAHFQLGFCRQQLGNRPGAVQAFVRAVELLPGHLQALRALEELAPPDQRPEWRARQTSLTPQIQVDRSFTGDIVLVGYDLADTSFSLGGTYPFNTYWRLARDFHYSSAYAVDMLLVYQDPRDGANYMATNTQELFPKPLAQWQVGEIVVVQHLLSLWPRARTSDARGRLIGEVDMPANCRSELIVRLFSSQGGGEWHPPRPGGLPSVSLTVFPIRDLCIAPGPAAPLTGGP